MTKKAILLAPFLAVIIFLFSASSSYADEGTVDLRSTTGEVSRCVAFFVLLQDQNYNILVSCRDLIYPVDSSALNYTVWATPTKGGSAIKLGTLGFGTASFRTNQQFSNLFVTNEKDQYARTPQGGTVMRGTVEPVTFLERPTTPTPTSGTSTTSGSTQATPTGAQTTTSKLLVGLQRAGILSVIALVAIVGLVFVITRARG